MEKYIMKAVEAYIENQESKIFLLQYEVDDLKKRLADATAEIERLRGEQQC